MNHYAACPRYLFIRSLHPSSLAHHLIANFWIVTPQIAVKDIELSGEIGSAIYSIGKEIGRWESYLRSFTYPRVQEGIVELFAHVINFAVRAKTFYQTPLPRMCIL